MGSNGLFWFIHVKTDSTYDRMTRVYKEGTDIFDSENEALEAASRMLSRTRVS